MERKGTVNYFILVIAMILVLLAPITISLFPKVEEEINSINVSEKLLANNTGNYAKFYLVNQVSGNGKNPWTFGRSNNTRNLDIFCAQEGAVASSWSSPNYEEVVWNEISGVWKNKDSYKKITWIKNNLWERANVSNSPKYTDNEKLAILKEVDTTITLQDVQAVYGSSTEKFKLNQMIVWNYTNGHIIDETKILSGSTLKIYYAINKLADKYYNTTSNIKINAADEAIWNAENKTYTWEVSIENSYPLSYENANNGQSTFVLKDKDRVLVEGTDYTYDGKIITIKGLENGVHTFSLEVSTFTISNTASVWVASSAQNLIEITDSKKNPYPAYAQVTTAKTIENGKFNLNLIKVDSNNTPVENVTFKYNEKEVTTNSNGIVEIANNEIITEKEKTFEYTITETETLFKYLKLKNPITAVLKSGVRTDSNGTTYFSIVNAYFKDNNSNTIEVETENGKKANLKIELSHINDTTTVLLTVPNYEKIYDLALTKTIVITTDDYIDEYDINKDGKVLATDASMFLVLASFYTDSENGLESGKITDFLSEKLPEAYEKYYKYYTEEELKNMIAANAEEAREKRTKALSIYADSSAGRDQDRIQRVISDSVLNENGNTTARYDLNKTVYEVEPTDEIIYKISVYNEGDYDSKNITITDYLPKGLNISGIEVDTAKIGYDGKEYVWTVDKNNNTASITIADVLKAYNGKDLKNIDVYIKCEIDQDMLKSGELKYDDILYNVAEITNSQPIDSQGNEVTGVKDRDSDENSIVTETQGNVVDEYTDRFEQVEDKEPSVNDINKSKYEYQDDDDFERIVIKENLKILDLSLRKSITKVGNSEENMLDVGSERKYSDFQKNLNRLPVITEDSNIYRLKNDDGLYFHPKQAVKVKNNDFVEYTIRVYNEGGRDDYAGIATQITDYLPDGLEFYAIVNNDGKWITTAENGVYKTTIDDFYGGYEAKYDVTNNKVVIDYIGTLPLRTKNYLYQIYEFFKNGTETFGYYNSKEDNREKYIYEEIKIICKVTSTVVSKELTNIAEITGSVAVEANGTVIDGVKDKDSSPNLVISNTTDMNNNKANLDTYYKDREIDDIYKDNYPGCEDDDDFETVILEEIIIPDKPKEIDLSLRKFISAVNGVELKGEESREPIVDVSKLVSGESTTAKYTHTKAAKLVSPKDIVTYTLRVYNEGETDGYATQIMDDVPEGVEMVAPTYDETGKPTNLNAEYGWIMLKEYNETQDKNNTSEMIRYDGKMYIITDNAQEAKLIVTNYLSKENGETMKADSNAENPNLIKKFNSEIMKTPYFKDVRVEFIVKASNKENEVITNYAQITDDSDSQGNPVDDRDSTPNVWEESPRDDDQDVENIKVKYFDLALYKWVTTTIVTEDGKTIEYASEHTQDDKTKLVNVTIPKEKLDETLVKFKYTIKVENQGNLAGYAKEIKDHIPQGLKFVAEDNKEFGWNLENDGTITTNYLKDTLLQPGETAEVEVILTWINGENNFGEKWNFAEISEDYNEYGAPDIDSTPNNFKDEVKEDDEDKDVVMLHVRTGSGVILYAGIGMAVMTIIAAGVIGIKKFVL